MYSPKNSLEHSYFDTLWQSALIFSGTPLDSKLNAKEALQFFQKSNIDTSYLKMVWSLSSPTTSMTKPQFYTALRYISMIQNGYIPISKVRMLSEFKLNIGLPRFSIVDLPENLSPEAFTTALSPAPAASLSVNNNAAAYAITAIDHGKYHDLFVSYDGDRDGYLTAEESLVVFRKSGLQADLLLQIFHLADCDKDSRLTSKEFAVAFHLILCNTKKGLPVPTNGLPPMLKGFMAKAPNVPGGVLISSTISSNSLPSVVYPSTSLRIDVGSVSNTNITNHAPNFAPAASKAAVSTFSAFEQFGELRRWNGDDVTATVDSISSRAPSQGGENQTVPR